MPEDVHYGRNTLHVLTGLIKFVVADGSKFTYLLTYLLHGAESFLRS
jgi:hypothetical protein